jgi:hypothetical protein
LRRCCHRRNWWACHIYGLLNSDSQFGARAALFQKLYGAAALTANETTEAEWDEQTKTRAESTKREEAADAAASEAPNIITHFLKLECTPPRLLILCVRVLLLQTCRRTGTVVVVVVAHQPCQRSVRYG